MKNDKMQNEYDSTPDCNIHKMFINSVFDMIILPELSKRAKEHDLSKLESPEKECYDKYIPLLRTAKYGSKEYTKIRDNMQKEGLDHHYKANRHHPEHFKNGVNDMNLIDFVEMICDWFAASLKSDTSFIDGLDTNVKKYNLPDMIVNIIKNTFNDYFKDFETLLKSNNKKDSLDSLKLKIFELNYNGYMSDGTKERMMEAISILMDNTYGK